MSIVLAAGGSGGHLFPALRLKEALSDQRILFMGHGLSTCPFFDRSGALWHDVPSGKNPLILMRGVARACHLLRKEKTRLVVGFGSYHSAPVLLAARLLRIPMAIFEADASLGRVSRFFAPGAQLIASPFSHPYPQAIQVAMPVRDGGASRQEALSYFGLNEKQPILLIFGGSQGAQALNELDLTSFLRREKIQLIHITGKGKSSLHQEGVIKPFEERLDLAMRCATIALCRSGSSTVNELIHFSLPSLLIPYPFARAHQEQNARHFVEQVGGGKMLLQREMTPEKVEAALKELLLNRELVRKALEQYKTSSCTRSLAEAIRGLL